VLAQYVLLANLMITAVEQDVVNEAVGEVINHVPNLVKSSTTAHIARWNERYRDVPREVTGLNLSAQIAPAFPGLESAWARFMTEQILVLMFPTETLRLGRDLPPRSPGQPFFPPDLIDLETNLGTDGDKQIDTGVARLVAYFDRSRADGRGSGANDWRQYDDRMNWAVNMLRSRQQDLSLYWCPYTQEDQERILNGMLPLRDGDPSDFEVEAPLGGLPPRNWP
jgi:hypothetical protein